MPLIKLDVSNELQEEKRKEVLVGISKILAEVTGKPERYVMATVAQADFLMGGEEGPAAFIDVRGIGGLTPAVNKALSQELCVYVEQVLSVPKERVYITFTDVAAGNWGCNGVTFG